MVTLAVHSENEDAQGRIITPQKTTGGQRKFGTRLSANVPHGTPAKSTAKKVVRVRRTPSSVPSNSSQGRRSANAGSRSSQHKAPASTSGIEYSVVFNSGSIGLQLEPLKEDPKYGCRVVRFVDGGPNDPGQARCSGRINPGDLVLAVKTGANFETVANTYEDMLQLLKQTHTTRELVFKSVWDCEFLDAQSSLKVRFQSDTNATANTQQPKQPSQADAESGPLLPLSRPSAIPISYGSVAANGDGTVSPQRQSPLPPPPPPAAVASTPQSSSHDFTFIKSPTDLVLLAQSPFYPYNNHTVAAAPPPKPVLNSPHHQVSPQNHTTATGKHQPPSLTPSTNNSKRQQLMTSPPPAPTPTQANVAKRLSLSPYTPNMVSPKPRTSPVTVPTPTSTFHQNKRTSPSPRHATFSSPPPPPRSSSQSSSQSSPQSSSPFTPSRVKELYNQDAQGDKLFSRMFSAVYNNVGTAVASSSYQLGNAVATKVVPAVASSSYQIGATVATKVVPAVASSSFQLGSVVTKKIGETIVGNSSDEFNHVNDLKHKLMQELNQAKVALEAQESDRTDLQKNLADVNEEKDRLQQALEQKVSSTVAELAKVRSAADESQRSLESEIKALREQKENLRLDVDRLEAELRDLQKHHESSLEASEQQHGEELARLTSEIDAIREELNKNEVQCSDIQQQRLELEVRCMESDERRTELEGENQMLGQKIQDLTNHNDKLDGDMAAMKMELEMSKTMACEMEERLMQLETAKTNLIKHMQSSQATASQNAGSLNDAIKEKEAQLESLQQELTTTCESLEALQAELQECKAQLTTTEAELRTAKTEQSTIEAQLKASAQRAESEREELQHTIENAEVELSVLRDASNKLRSENEEYESAMNKQATELTDAKSQLQEISAERTNIATELQTQTEQLDMATAEHVSLNTKIVEMQSIIDDQQCELDQAEERLVDERQKSSQLVQGNDTAEAQKTELVQLLDAEKQQREQLAQELERQTLTLQQIKSNKQQAEEEAQKTECALRDEIDQLTRTLETNEKVNSERLEELEAANSRLRTVQASLGSDAVQKQQELEDLRQLHEQSELQALQLVQQHKMEIDSANAQCCRLRAEMDDMAKENERLTSVCQASSDELKQHQDAMATLEQDAREKADRLLRVEQDLQNAAEQKKAHIAEIESLAKDKQSLTTKASALQQRVDEVESRNDDLVMQAAKAQDEFQDTENQLVLQQKEISDLRTQLRSAEDENQDLRADLEKSVKSNEAKGRQVLSSIHKMAEKLSMPTAHIKKVPLDHPKTSSLACAASFTPERTGGLRNLDEVEAATATLISALETRLNHVTKELSDATQQLDNSTAEIDEVRKQAEGHESTISILEANKSVLEKELSTAMKMVTESEYDMNRLETELESSTAEVRNLLAEVDDLKQSNSAITDDIKTNLARSSSQNAQLRESLSAATLHNGELKAKVHDLEDDLKDSQQRELSAEENQQRLQTTAMHLQQRIATLERDNASATTTIATLKHIIEELTAEKARLLHTCEQKERATQSEARSSDQLRIDLSTKEDEIAANIVQLMTRDTKIQALSKANKKQQDALQRMMHHLLDMQKASHEAKLEAEASAHGLQASVDGLKDSLTHKSICMAALQHQFTCQADELDDLYNLNSQIVSDLELVQQRHAEVTDELALLQEDFNAAKTELVYSELKIKELKHDKAKEDQQLHAHIDDLEGTCRQLESENKTLESEISALQLQQLDSNDIHAGELERLEMEIECAKQELETVHKNRNAERNENECIHHKLSEDIRSLTLRNQAAAKDLTVANQRVMELEEIIDEEHAVLNQFKEKQLLDMQANDKSSTDLKSQLEKCQEDLEDATLSHEAAKHCLQQRVDSLQLDLTQTKTELSDTRSRLDSARQELQTETARRNDSMIELEQLKQTQQEELDAVRTEHDQTIAKVVRDRDASERMYHETLSQVESMKIELATAVHSSNNEHKVATKLKHDNEQLKKSLKAVENDLADLRCELLMINEELEESTQGSQCSDLSDEFDAGESRGGLKQKLKAAEETLIQHTETNENFQKQISMLQTRSSSLSDELKNLQHTNKKLEMTIASLRDSKAQREAEMQRSEESVAEQAAVADKLRADLNRRLSENAGLSVYIENLATEIEMMSETQREMVERHEREVQPLQVCIKGLLAEAIALQLLGNGQKIKAMEAANDAKRSAARVQSLEIQLHEVISDSEATTKLMEKANAEMDALETQLHSKATECDDLQQLLSHAKQNENELLHSLQASNAEVEARRLEIEKEQLESQQQREVREQLAMELAEASRVLASHKAKIKSLECGLAEATQDAASRSEHVDSLLESVQTAGVKHLEQVQDMQQRLEVLRAERDAVLTEKDECEEAVGEHLRKISHLERVCESMQERYDEQKQVQKDLKAKLKATQSSFDECEHTKRHIEKDLANKKLELEHCHSQLDVMEATVSRLKSDCVMLSESDAQRTSWGNDDDDDDIVKLHLEINDLSSRLSAASTCLQRERSETSKLNMSRNHLLEFVRATINDFTSLHEAVMMKTLTIQNLNEQLTAQRYLPSLDLAGIEKVGARDVRSCLDDVVVMISDHFVSIESKKEEFERWKDGDRQLVASRELQPSSLLSTPGRKGSNGAENETARLKEKCEDVKRILHDDILTPMKASRSEPRSPEQQHGQGVDTDALQRSIQILEEQMHEMTKDLEFANISLREKDQLFSEMEALVSQLESERLSLERRIQSMDMDVTELETKLTSERQRRIHAEQKLSSSNVTRRPISVVSVSSLHNSNRSETKLAAARMMMGTLERRSSSEKAVAFRKWTCATSASLASSQQEQSAMALSKQLEITREKLVTLKSRLRNGRRSSTSSASSAAGLTEGSEVAKKSRLLRLLDKLDKTKRNGKENSGKASF